MGDMMTTPKPMPAKLFWLYFTGLWPLSLVGVHEVDGLLPRFACCCAMVFGFALPLYLQIQATRRNR